MSRYGAVTVAAIILASSACTASSPDTGDGSVPSVNRNYITQEQIRGTAARNALDAVRTLRPAWLVKRGPQSVSFEADIVVYFGRARLGGLQALSEIAAGTITSMEFLTPAAANFRFGAGHPYGAIVVLSQEPDRK